MALFSISWSQAFPVSLVFVGNFFRFWIMLYIAHTAHLQHRRRECRLTCLLRAGFIWRNHITSIQHIGTQRVYTLVSKTMTGPVHKGAGAPYPPPVCFWISFPSWNPNSLPSNSLEKTLGPSPTGALSKYGAPSKVLWSMRWWLFHLEGAVKSILTSWSNLVNIPWPSLSL